MITQTNYQQGSPPPSTDPVDLKAQDMSPPQTSILTSGFEEDEFEMIPQVALPGMVGEKVTNQAGQESSNNQGGGQENVHRQPHSQLMVNYGTHQQPYDNYYNQIETQQQWIPEYQQVSYHYQAQPYQSNQSYYTHPYQQPQIYQREEIPGQYHSMPHNNMSIPGRSPSGSHSTPSPGGELGGQSLQEDHSMSDLKRPHADAFRADNGGLNLNSHQNPAKKPKVSRRKKKRDPNEPSKPVSAYALFFRDSQASIKGRNPNLSFGDVSKMVASLWDSLDADSKAMYKKRTEMAKKEYLRQLASYRATLVSKGQGDEIYGGFPGYGYPVSMGQNIPPHPPSHQPHPQALQQLPHPGSLHQHQNGYAVTNGHEYLNHQATAHGTDISTGNQTGMPSLPAQQPGGATPDTGNGNSSTGQQLTNSPSPGYHSPPDGSYADNGPNNGPSFNSTGTFQFDGGLGASGALHDRNHNLSFQGGPGGRIPGQCGRPGCGRPVNKAEDGTESTYCSSECVVGQCREVYSSWATGVAGGVGPPQPPPQQAPQVK